MIASSDHISPLTGATVTVNLSKAGGAFGAAGGTVTEISNGWYKVALNTTDTGTLGDLAYHCTATSGDNTDFSDEVVAFNPLDSVRIGLTALPNASAGGSGGLGTVDSTNSIKIQTPAKKNTALNNFTFVMLNVSGNPQTGLTVTAQRALDGGAFGSCANSVTELASGWYTINLANTDTNATNVALRFSAVGARDTNILLLMLP